MRVKRAYLFAATIALCNLQIDNLPAVDVAASVFANCARACINRKIEADLLTEAECKTKINAAVVAVPAASACPATPTCPTCPAAAAPATPAAANYSLKATYSDPYNHSKLRDSSQWGVTLSQWSSVTRNFSTATGLGGSFELWQNNASPKKFKLVVKSYVLDGNTYYLRSARVVFSNKAAFIKKLNEFNAGNSTVFIDSLVLGMEPIKLNDWKIKDFSNIVIVTSEIQENKAVHGPMAGYAIEWNATYKNTKDVPDWGSGMVLTASIYFSAR